MCEKSDSELRSLPKQEIELKENATELCQDEKVYVVTVDGDTVELLEGVPEETTMLEDEITEQLTYTDDVKELEGEHDDDQNDPDFLE